MRGGPSLTERGAKPFDATTKYLIDADPVAWLALGHLAPSGPVAPFDPNLDTIQAEADRVLRVTGPPPWLAHVEVQTSHDPALQARLLQYSALLYRRHGLPVQTIIVLLRREADGAELSGTLDLARPDGTIYLSFAYTAVRVWEQDVQSLLAGPLGTLPLAPLASVPPPALPSVVRQIGERIRREATPDQAGQLWTATYFLLGLRHDVDESTRRVLEEVRAMRESSTYQAVLDEGRVEGRLEEAKRLLLRLGQARLGPPDARAREALDALADLGRAEALAERLLVATSWDDLLTGPQPGQAAS